MSFEAWIGKAIGMKLGAAQAVIGLLPSDSRSRARDGCRNAALALADAAFSVGTALRGGVGKMGGQGVPGPVKVVID